MKKVEYTAPQTDTIHLHLEDSIADLFIGVSGDTTPEESDGKENGYDDENDDDDNEEPFRYHRFKLWE